jgi:methylmalonyl-CoA mutase
MKDLFSEFKPATAADWKNQLIKDLKGESYESLVWHNDNGFNVQPFYTSEDLRQPYEPAFTHTGWEITITGRSHDPLELNKQLLRDLNNGATAVSVHCADHDPGVILNGIQLNYIHTCFYVNYDTAPALKKYLSENYDLKELNCSVLPEALNTLQDLENWRTAMQLFKGYRKIKTLGVDGLYFHNRNCLAYYEVAILLSALTEQLEILSSGNEIPESDVVIKTGVSSDYFIQMAKLRSIRRLWKLLKKEYKINNSVHLIVETGMTNKSVSDCYNNLLRTTVEAMAAVSGGCNELVVSGFDVLFPAKNNLSGRLAVNQQLILKEESYFDRMADVSCGSFYIESMTDAIARKALETFKRFEQEGGYFECIGKGIFEKEIQLQAQQREELVKTQQQLAIGVNKFKNEKEKIELPASRISELKQMPINNPVLNFELENYFNLKNA